MEENKIVEPVAEEIVENENKNQLRKNALKRNY